MAIEHQFLFFVYDKDDYPDKNKRLKITLSMCAKVGSMMIDPKDPFFFEKVSEKFNGKLRQYPEPIFEKYSGVNELLLYIHLIYEDRFCDWIQKNDKSVFGKLCRMFYMYILNVVNVEDDFTKNLIKLFANSRVPYHASDNGEHRILMKISDVLFGPSSVFKDSHINNLKDLSVYADRYRFNLPDPQDCCTTTEYLFKETLKLLVSMDDVAMNNTRKSDQSQILNMGLISFFLVKYYLSKEITIEDGIQFLTRCGDSLALVITNHYHFANIFGMYINGGDAAIAVSRSAYYSERFYELIDLFIRRIDLVNSHHLPLLSTGLILSSGISLESFEKSLDYFKKVISSVTPKLRDELLIQLEDQCINIRRKEYTHIIIQKIYESGYLSDSMTIKTRKRLLYIPGPYFDDTDDEYDDSGEPKSRDIESLDFDGLNTFLSCQDDWGSGRGQDHNIRFAVELTVRFGIYEAISVIHQMSDKLGREFLKEHTFFTKPPIEKHNQFMVKWYETFGFPDKLSLYNIDATFHLSYFLQNKPPSTISYKLADNISPAIMYILHTKGLLENKLKGFSSSIAKIISSQ